MKCVKCNTELTRGDLQADGSVMCPVCGAVYRPRNKTTNSTPPSTEQFRQDRSAVASSERSNDTSYTPRRARSTPIASHSTPHTTRTSAQPRTSKPIIALAIAVVLIVGIVAAVMIARGNNSGVIQASGNSTSISIFESAEEKGLKNLLSRLQSAYNNQDLYGIIGCFDPSVSEATFGIMKLFGLSDAFKSIVPFASKVIGASGIIDNSSWGTCNLSIVEYNVNGSEGSLTYQVAITYNDGSTNTFNDTANVMKVEDTWYFSAIQPVSTKTIEYGPIPVNPNITDTDVQGTLYTIEENWKKGYINESGVEIVAPYFRDMKSFDDNLCGVTMDGQNWGFIDRMGKLVIDYTIPGLGNPSANGWYTISNNGKTGAYNPHTGASISISYDEFGSFNDSGLVPAKKDGFWGLIDLNENVVVDFIYSKMENRFNGVSVSVCINNAWGVIDRNGNYLLPLAADQKKVSTTDSGLIFCEGNLYDQNMNPLFAEVMDLKNLADGRVYFRTQHEADYPYPTFSNLFDRSIILSKTGSILADSDVIIKDYLSTHPENIGTSYNYITFDIDHMSDHYIKMIMYCNNNYCNLISLDGNVPIREWLKQGTRASCDLVDALDLAVYTDYEEPIKASRIYDLKSGSILGEYPCFERVYSNPIGRNLVAWRKEDNSRKYYLIHLDEGGDSSFTIDNAEINGSSVLLFDGVFYGVYANGGFVGQGLSYTSASYNPSMQIYTLSVGVATEKYRIGADGTVNRLQ